jgi:hypothetical protein
MYHGRLPNRAHVYAWLVPVPAAQRLCTGSESAHVVAVDYATLYALRLSQQTIGPRTVALPPTWPCHMNPTPDAPMDFAVTFDPDNRTWTEHSDGAIWIERRRLRIDAAGGHHR